MDGTTIPEWAEDNSCLPEFDPTLLDGISPEPVAKRARTDTLSPVSDTSSSGRFTTTDTQALYTLKVTYDSRWAAEDYLKICDALFADSPKVLVVAEKMRTNAHVHFHGYSYLAPATFKKKAPAIIKPMHYMCTPGHPGHNPRSRPVQGMGCVATEVGFQYLCKEPPNAQAPLYQRGFTPEELMELHAKSQEHVKTLKFNIREFILTLPMNYPGKTTNEVWQTILKQVGMKLREEGKDINRYTRQDVKNGMLHHPDCSPTLAGWLIGLN